MKRQFPPTSQRYCAFCKSETTFKYNHKIGHSCCKECGWHYIPTLDLIGQYQKEVAAFELTKGEKLPDPKEAAKTRELQKLKRLKNFKYKG